MGVGFLKGLVGAIAFSAASVIGIGTAAAQTAPSQGPTVPQAFEDAAFTSTGNFYENRSLGGQINYLVGPGSLIRNGFPENQIARDARRINQIYRDTLSRQVSTTPVIRTPDLPNPFESSLLLSPIVPPQVTEDFRLAPAPALPPVVQPQTVPGPVPALF